MRPASREPDPWVETRFARRDVFVARNAARRVFCSPFHLEPRAACRSVPEFHSAEAERYFRGLAARRQIDVFGSYDADASGCGAEDLYDPSHPRPACLTKILALGARLPDSLN
jgi:hypothetical protein